MKMIIMAEINDLKRKKGKL